MYENIYWIARVASDTYRIFTDDKNARPFIEGLNLLRAGKSLSEIWEPVLLPLYAGDEGEEEQEKNKPIPDFARGIFGLAMSKKAHSILQPVIEGQAVFLELDTDAGLYYELDIQKIRCLNIDKSIMKRFSSGGIMRIEKYSFDYRKLQGVHIFHIVEQGYPDFVSDEFKKTVERNNLTGLTFFPVPLVDE